MGWWKSCNSYSSGIGPKNRYFRNSLSQQLFKQFDIQKNMKDIQKLLIIFLAILLFTACKKENKSAEEVSIQVTGIEFKPNCFTENGEIIGTDVEIASMAMNNAGINIEININELWEDAYTATLAGPNRALLTVAYSKERESLFKWAGPISQGSYRILSKGKTGIGSAIGIDAAKEIESIAVVTDWLETSTLEKAGFANLVYYNSYNEAIEAFKDDEVKSIASNFFQFTETVSNEYYRQEKIDVCANYRTTFYYIAFSKDIDDAIVDKCQVAIDEMIATKETLAITQKYISYASSRIIPGHIQLFTEVAPPFNYIASISGSDVLIEGSSKEIVDNIQSENTFVNEVNISSWLDAYNIIQYLPNSALYTTARTPEREDLFQWVGPISNVRACFYTLSESGIQVATLEQAKHLNSIATPKGWYTHDYLLTNNFQNIVATATTPNQAFNQLINGEVEALLMFDLATNWMCKTTNTPLSLIEEQMEVNSYKGYIAFSKNTPVSTVQEWQNNLDAIKANGTFESIWNKWYGDVEMP